MKGRFGFAIVWKATGRMVSQVFWSAKEAREFLNDPDEGGFKNPELLAVQKVLIVPFEEF
jgi:hypothetical protein